MFPPASPRETLRVSRKQSSLFPSGLFITCLLFGIFTVLFTDHFVRFRVIIEMLKPDKPDSATTLKGLDYTDVPGLSKREYKLNFFAHKEGTFSAKVRNIHTWSFLALSSPSVSDFISSLPLCVFFNVLSLLTVGA